MLMMLFGIGTYTFSEIAPEIIPISDQNHSLNNNITQISFNLPVYTSHKYVLGDDPVSGRKIVLKPSEDVMDKGNISESVLANFLLEHNQSIDFDYAFKVASLYINEASHEGVNSDLAFTQMCLETGFLKFGGDVDPDQYNYCGLGATGNGVKGLSFKNPEEGIRAHIQHLKAYGSTKKLKKDIVDGRFKYVNRGSGIELSDLTGKWATDKYYDKKIRDLMDRLYQVAIE
jgi:hypothetical protein